MELEKKKKKKKQTSFQQARWLLEESARPPQKHTTFAPISWDGVKSQMKACARSRPLVSNRLFFNF